MIEEENEKRVRAFYEATVPGHRESLRGLQAPHVVYDMPEGMPMGCGHFEGLQDVLDRFLTNFYKALDVHFVAEEFIAAGEEDPRVRAQAGVLKRSPYRSSGKTVSLMNVASHPPSTT